MSLNQAQKRAVSHGEGPCLVLAGPGSGKTLTIAKRIEYLIKVYKVRPEEILVITFTRYAAGEMRERFRRVMGSAGAPVTFGTFHSVYYGILRWAYGLGSRNILTEEERYRILREILASERRDGAVDTEADADAEAQEKELLEELSGELGRIKNQGISAEEYEPGSGDDGRLKERFRQYEERKRALKKVDFEDMLLLCRRLFRERADILGKWQQRFRYILVDEFQDINQVQYDVIRMLAAPEDNLFAVGDDDQSVYGFRGARPGIMKQFMEDYPGAERIVLDINYRCGSRITEAASRLIARNRSRYDKRVRSAGGEEGMILVRQSESPLEESRYVSEEYKRLRRQGVPAEQIGVLFRTAADARALAGTFAEQGLPFRMRERVENIYGHFTCADMCAYLRLASGRYARGDLLRVANRPNRYIGRDSVADGDISYEGLRRYYCDKRWMIERIDSLERDMEVVRDIAPYAAIQYLRSSVGYDAFLREYAGRQGLDLKEITDILDELQERAAGYRTAEEWLEHAERQRQSGKEEKDRGAGGEGAAFLTMHGAKGLEYETVFIIQANEGTVPHKKAVSAEALEEERRLFYVAMTRAKRRLVISYSRKPSPFIDEIKE